MNVKSCTLKKKSLAEVTIHFPSTITMLTRYDMLNHETAFQKINTVIYSNVSDCGSVACYQY